MTQGAQPRRTQPRRTQPLDEAASVSRTQLLDEAAALGLTRLPEEAAIHGRTVPTDRAVAASPESAARRRTYAWQDPAITGAVARELPGADFLSAIASGALPPPPIGATLDFGVPSVQPGRVVFEITPSEFHYNPIGTVHGGVAATLCDSACGCAVHSMLPAGAYYTSLDLTVKFLRPITATTGRLRCEGTVTHLGSRTALAQASLTDDRGKLYAHATSSCLIFRPDPAQTS
jgi:uncharacterized protein (TIGR00369 family)